MSTPRKRAVKIYMTPRATTDSPEILNQVSQAFPQDDLDITITDEQQEPVKPIEPQLAKEAHQNAKNALDLQDQAIKQGMVTIPSLKKAKDAAQNLWQVFSQEGVKTTARVIFEALIQSLFGM